MRAQDVPICGGAKVVTYGSSMTCWSMCFGDLLSASDAACVKQLLLEASSAGTLRSPGFSEVGSGLVALRILTHHLILVLYPLAYASVLDLNGSFTLANQQHGLPPRFDDDRCSESEQKELNTWVSFQSAEQPLLGQFSVSGNSSALPGSS